MAEEKWLGEQWEQAAAEGGSQLTVPTKTVGKGTSMPVKRRAPTPPGGQGLGVAEGSAGEDAEDISTIVQRAVNGAMRVVVPDVTSKVTAGSQARTML